jgi:hypothetical protein
MTKTVTDLYADFEKMLADIQARDDEIDRENAAAAEKLERMQAQFDGVVTLTDDLCHRIITTPANPADPIPDMLMKIAAAGWSTDAKGPYDRWDDSFVKPPERREELACLIALRKDLQALAESKSGTDGRH